MDTEESKGTGVFFRASFCEDHFLEPPLGVHDEGRFRLAYRGELCSVTGCGQAAAWTERKWPTAQFLNTWRQTPWMYPAEHAALARRIAETGAVIGEYPLGVRAHARNFPRRNRILSGLTLGTLVVEAGIRSGAMLTVTHALEQNREVFAVPGSVLSAKSAGANWLIQQGAKLVTEVGDILEELNIVGLGRQLELTPPAPEIGTVESRLLALLAGEPVHVDEITRESGLPISVVSSTLTMLELAGLARQAGPMAYVAVPRAGAAATD